MHSQKSFKNDNEGKLYLVPTPIGNLEDMTFRAVRILKEADVIAAEDTRNTKKLCHYYDICTPLTSYHEHNKDKSGERLLERLQKGEKVALVSDAGMPTISDPGYELVAATLKAQISVIPLPGANAGLTALTASGLPTQPYYFYGFLNRNKKEKRKALTYLQKQTATFILYESPYRLKETLKLAYDILGNRRITICRELSKKFEEFLRGDIESALQWVEEEDIRGEFCLIIEGTSATEEEKDSKNEWWSHLTIEEHVQYYIEQNNMIGKEAIKQVAKERNLTKRTVYQAYHNL